VQTGKPEPREADAAIARALQSSVGECLAVVMMEEEEEEEECDHNRFAVGDLASLESCGSVG